MKKFFCSCFLVLNLFFSVHAVADCSGQGGLNEGIFNETGIPLVASTYMHWQVWQVNDDSSNVVNNTFVASRTIGGVSYSTGKNNMPGSMRIQSCAGGTVGLTTHSRAYDLGVSVGPYNFFPHQGSWPHWETGLDRNYMPYLLDTDKWSNRDIYWSIYAPGKKYFSVKKVAWPERSKCLTDDKSYSICWAVDLENCNPGGSCDTWADYYINNLGSSQGKPIAAPLGKM